MKLKDIIQVAVMTVIGFALGMVISMFTGTLGMVALYVSAGLAAFVVGPTFVIMANKIKKRGAAFLFWLVYGLLYTLMGYWTMIPICLVSAILSEIIIGDYSQEKRIGLAFTVGMFVVAMHPILFIKFLGPETILKLMPSFTPEQLDQMVKFYTAKTIGIAIGLNILLEFLAGRYGLFIERKFFGNRKKKGIL